MTTPTGPEPIFIRPGDQIRTQTGYLPGEGVGMLAGFVLPALLLQTM